MVDLEVLLELQDLDTELEEYRSQRRALPAELNEIEEAVEAAKAEVEASEAELKGLRVDIREAEGRIAQLDESQQKYKQQLLTVKTNREYSALLTEIENVKKQKEELEDEVIRKMDQVEAVEASIAGKKEQLEKLEAERDEKRKELDGKLKELDGEIGVREQKRDELTADVPNNVQGLYERIMSSKISRAVVNVRNGSCGGCFAQIPLQKVADIRIGETVYTCDHCGRILYYNENENG